MGALGAYIFARRKLRSEVPEDIDQDIYHGLRHFSPILYHGQALTSFGYITPLA